MTISTIHSHASHTAHSITNNENKFSINNQNVYSPSANKDSYDRVTAQISQRYAYFDPKTHLGYGGMNGITADLDGISKKDIIGTMMHIRDTDHLLEQCKKNSRSAPFFNKFYLLSMDGWNLRLHFFNAKSNGLGGEDSPHYHRWELASTVLTGGYLNRNYERKSTEETSPDELMHVYDEYKLGSTNSQGAANSRSAEFQGKATMIPTKSDLYDKGSLNHFPIDLAHSVQTMPNHFGSTITLAHTSKAQTDHSLSYKKPEELGTGLVELPEIKSENDPEFDNKFKMAIAHIQVLKLQEDLMDLFEKKWETGNKLNPYEGAHQYDSYERNYVETSLLSALAIYGMENDATPPIPHREFSPDTVKFLDRELATIDKKALELLIEQNQQNLAEQLFKTEDFTHSQLREQFNRQFDTKLATRLQKTERREAIS
jgi:hypothetical protein